MVTKIKMVKATDIEYMVQRAVAAQDHAEAMETSTNEAAHRLQMALGEAPHAEALTQARDAFYTGFVTHYAKIDADMGAPHMRAEIRVLKNGSKTVEVLTEQYKARRATATTRWSRMLRVLGWREAKEGATPGRKPKTHACPHCSASVAFVKGVLEKAASA